MARRSSARLRSRNSSTPKRVSLSHDAPGRTPRTAPHKLESLEEHDDEMPGAFPASPPPNGMPTRAAKRINTGVQATPKNVTPIKPAEEEMHPQKHHGTTAKPLDEARYLGFSNMGSNTAPPTQASRIATLQATPTRAQTPANAVKSPAFQFTFTREHSLELSPEAKRLMVEKREEAARIREQMMASGESSNEALEAAARKKATPKGKKGRFSEAHKEQFAKMDSIAAHPSAFRVDSQRAKPGITSQQKEDGTTEMAKSLKRSPSKAQLDDTNSAPQHGLHHSPSKPTLIQTGSQLPRTTATYALASRNDADSSSPAKRIKRTATEDVSASRSHSSSDDDSAQLSTPQRQKTLRMHPSNPNLSHLTTPTQAILVRAASVKSTKTSSIPAPSVARSHSKSVLVDQKQDRHAPNTLLLARSPSKAALFAKPAVEKAADGGSPLLSRSPLKPSPPKKASEPIGGDEAKVAAAPLLARSPLKMSVTKRMDIDSEVEKQPSIPLLARSPSKIALPSNPATMQVSASPGKTMGLMSRFNLLRASPMKSILRSPRRLYSVDPAKVAAGTHLATPPKQRHVDHSALHTRPPGTASAQKRVDFSSSTKARYEVKESSSTPSKAPTPPQKDTVSEKKTPMEIDYPTLPSWEGGDTATVSPSPQKRRQTVAPGDFTFRADGHGIVFGTSPKAPASAARNKRPSIRHVSAEPTVVPATTIPPPTVQGSKKRKFEFENHAVSAPEAASVPDKENVAETEAADAEEHRPAKRAKIDLSAASDVSKTREPSLSPTKRLPTLGVKPKGTKSAVGGKDAKAKKEGHGHGRPSTISQAKLNALAMPKNRG